MIDKIGDPTPPLRLTAIVLFGMGLLRCLFRFTQDFSGGFVREAEILFDGGALLDLEKDHGGGNAHTSEEQTPAGSELGHEGGFLGVHAGNVLEKDSFIAKDVGTYRHIPAAPADWIPL